MTPGARGARRVAIAAGAGCLAAVVFATSALAETDSVRFEYGENGTWTVPDRVTEIEVEVAGAGGGGGSTKPGGNGALVQAAISVTGGMTFDVGVGGGGESTRARQSGGGGASIMESGDILIIAGGGGGTTSWRDAFGGNAGHNTKTGAGQKGGGNSSSGGNPGVDETGGVLTGGTAGQDYDPDNGLNGNGGQTGRSAVVGGAGGEARNDSPGGGGGAGFGGGSSGKAAILDLRGGGGGGGSIARGPGVGEVEGAASFYSSNGGAGGSGQNVSGTDGWVVITWVIPAPPPDPELPGADADTPREPVILQLTMPAGAQCSSLQVDSSGPWVRLPAADDCSIESTARVGSLDDESELLGWATTPDFSVDLAQRQVENGWGAYETFDSSGDLSAVFIPAGGWAQASSDTSLFPIWEQLG